VQISRGCPEGIRRGQRDLQKAAGDRAENDKALAAMNAPSRRRQAAGVPRGPLPTLARLQRHADAIASCTDALKINPDFASALLERGHFFINARQVDKAIPT
jgi:hypothetical protein